MRNEFNQGDRVVLRESSTIINRHLEIGDTGVVVRASRRSDTVAVMFDREFSGGIGFTPYSHSDAILIERGYVEEGKYIARRCDWIPIESLGRENHIQWIE